MPFGLYCPQPVASIAAVVVIGTQVWLVASGNFSWLNWTAIVLEGTDSAVPDDSATWQEYEVKGKPGAAGNRRVVAAVVAR